MGAKFHIELEHPVENTDVPSASGEALARVIEAHPALSPLLDFAVEDPIQIARAVGLFDPREEDAEEDLNDIDLGPQEWFEPSVGLAVVRRALQALRNDPASIKSAIYDPSLRPEDVLADLDAVEWMLREAQQHETRFHFLTGD